MSRLYIFAGNPGSGKSFLARALYERLENSVLIQSDVVRHDMFPNPTYTPAEHETVFPVIHRMIADAFQKGVDYVLYDATNKTPWERKAPSQIADRFNADICIIHVDTPELIIRQRLKNRILDENMSDAGIDIFERMALKYFQPPTNSPWIRIDGSQPLEDNIQAILGK